MFLVHGMFLVEQFPQLSLAQFPQLTVWHVSSAWDVSGALETSHALKRREMMLYHIRLYWIILYYSQLIECNLIQKKRVLFLSWEATELATESYGSAAPETTTTLSGLRWGLKCELHWFLRLWAYFCKLRELFQVLDVAPEHQWPQRGSSTSPLMQLRVKIIF